MMTFSPAVRRRPAGFTILELVIASSIALAIFGVGFFAITHSLQARDEYDVRMRATENARLFFNKLEKEFAEAWPGPNEMALGVGDDNQFIVIREEKTDVIQFYTRVDREGFDDQFNFVRYYVNPDQKTLCRTPPSASLGAAPPDFEYHEEDAMFDEVEVLQVFYKKYDENGRQMVDATDPATASHIQFSLRVKHTVGIKDTVNTFTRILPIPASFRKQ